MKNTSLFAIAAACLFGLPLFGEETNDETLNPVVRAEETKDEEEEFVSFNDAEETKEEKLAATQDEEEEQATENFMAANDEEEEKGEEEASA